MERWTNVPEDWVGNDVELTAYVGGTPLAIGIRTIEPGETTGMAVKLQDYLGRLDDVADRGIVIAVDEEQFFFTWGAVVRMRLAPAEEE